MYYLLFFFNDPATTEIYTLSLHDALPIFILVHRVAGIEGRCGQTAITFGQERVDEDEQLRRADREARLSEPPERDGAPGDCEPTHPREGRADDLGHTATARCAAMSSRYQRPLSLMRRRCVS